MRLETNDILLLLRIIDLLSDPESQDELDDEDIEDMDDLHRRLQVAWKQEPRH